MHCCQVVPCLLPMRLCPYVSGHALLSACALPPAPVDRAGSACLLQGGICQQLQSEVQLLTAAAGISSTTALWMAEGSTLRPEVASAISGLKGQMQSAQSEVRLRHLSLLSKAWTVSQACRCMKRHSGLHVCDELPFLKGSGGFC